MYHRCLSIQVDTSGLFIQRYAHKHKGTLQVNISRFLQTNHLENSSTGLSRKT